MKQRKQLIIHLKNIRNTSLTIFLLQIRHIETRCILVQYFSELTVEKELRARASIQMFSLNFLMYTIGGVWMPIEWSSNIAKLLYNVFTTIVLVSLYFLMITQFMDIVLVVDNIDDFATNTLMFLTIVAVTCKATIVVVRRNAIINLVQVLLTAPCKPRDEDEMAIQMKFDKFIR